MKVEPSPWGDRKQLVDDRGEAILESSIVPTKLLFVKGTVRAGGRPGMQVTKEHLEELLGVKIIENLPEVTPGRSGWFNIGNRSFSPVTDNVAHLRSAALAYLAAADEIDRREVEEEAKKRAEEQAKKDAEAEAERVKAAEAEGKKRREIAAIRDIIAKESIVGFPTELAEKLYAAGVRKVD